MWLINNSSALLRGYFLGFQDKRIYHGVTQSFTEYEEKEILNSALLRGYILGFQDKRIYHGVTQSFTEYEEKEILNSVVLRTLRGYIIRGARE